jgi:hypothetical protein
MQGLLKILFKITIFSIIISIAAASIWVAFNHKNFSEPGTLIKHMIAGIFILNIILFIMALPVLFLSFPNVRGNIFIRLLLYFLGPLFFIGVVCFTDMDSLTKHFYLLSGLVFLVVHTIFYLKFVKNYINK